MLSGRRYRLELTAEQARACQMFGDVCRAVWNTALDQRRQHVDRYTRGRAGQFCGYHLQVRELAEAKTEETWLTRRPRTCSNKPSRIWTAPAGARAPSRSVTLICLGAYRAHD